MNNYWECICDCHNPDPAVTIMHIVACCSSCNNCRARVKFGSLYNDLHKEDCGKPKIRKNSHCSFCGKKFPGGVKFPHSCENCNNFTYTPPVTCVMLLLSIVREPDYATGVLLVRRSHEPMIGGLALPGGYLDPGESFEQAAVRELKEETGIIIDEKEVSYVGNRLATDGNMLVFMDNNFSLLIENLPEINNFKPNSEVSELVVCWDKDYGKVDICFPTHDEMIREHFFKMNGLR